MLHIEPTHEAIKSTIDSLQTIYTVVLGLSLGEAFMQFVAEDPANKTEHRICWERMVNLISFLFLIIPFFHGMNRYFFDTYLKSLGPGSRYGGHLLVDCAVFTSEGGLFFILCRSLSRTQWRRFYFTVIALLALDLGWSSIVIWRSSSAIQAWIILDVAGIVAISLILTIFRSKQNLGLRLGPIVGLVVVFLRTVADYWSSWSFYFPHGGQ